MEVQEAFAVGLLSSALSWAICRYWPAPRTQPDMDRDRLLMVAAVVIRAHARELAAAQMSADGVVSVAVPNQRIDAVLDLDVALQPYYARVEAAAKEMT